MKSTPSVVCIAACLLIGGALVGYFWPRQEVDDPLFNGTVASTFSGEGLENTLSEHAQPQAESDRVPRNALAGERILRFEDAQAYADYLAALDQAGYQPMSRIDALHAVRVSREAADQVNPDRFGGEADFSYRVEVPTPPTELDPALLSRLRPYGVSAYAIAGGSIEGEGRGITVAVLDSGIDTHPLLDQTTITELDYTGAGRADSTHGTAVASIIAGREGVAPLAELISVRVLDGEGQGSSFDLAAGILEAVDLGAQVINLSLGVYEDVPVLHEAVRYAQERGVVLVAAAGNHARNQLPYPGAYTGVLTVTAIDASGRQAIFPNRSTRIDFAAPGVGIETAGADGGRQLFSGTSAAAPLISGTLALLMSEGAGMTGAQAVDVLKKYLNDQGAPGVDPLFGGGVVDWGRLRERHIPGLNDIAMASVYLDPRGAPGKSSPVILTVQNRGTSWLSGATLEFVPQSGPKQTFSISSLQPGEIRSREVYVSLPTVSEDVFIFSASVELNDGLVDEHPENNQERMRYQPH